MPGWRSKGGMKRDKYDILFSYLVRERVNWICEVCRRDFKHDPHGLHCSHLFGRAKAGTRILPQNAFAHCANCHETFGQHPVWFAEWARQKLGEGEYRLLQFRASKATKITHHEKELIHKHFLKEKRRMKKLRMEGFQGRIEFGWPDVIQGVA